MRLLVCGGRDFGYTMLGPRRIWVPADVALMAEVLGRIHAIRPITLIIQGKARGADTLAELWAEAHGIPCAGYPADWDGDGRAAGPIRNERMLREGKPDKVVSFPGGAGTAHMVRIARKAGVDVITVERS